MHQSFPKIKYCGFTRSEDIREAIACGVGAIGLNLYPESPRFVGDKWSQEFVDSYREHVIARSLLAVGVFVNESHSQVSDAVMRFGLNCVQLHGDELPDWLDDSKSYPALANVRFLKAISWRGTIEDEQAALAWNDCKDPRLLGLLVDSFDPIQRGGTGKTVRWDLLYPRPLPLRGVKVLLAGGLRPENVALAVAAAHPDGVDIASGIEHSPGIKDHSAMRSVAETLKNWAD